MLVLAGAPIIQKRICMAPHFAGGSAAGGSVVQLEYDAVSMDELRKVGDVGLIEVRCKAARPTGVAVPHLPSRSSNLQQDPRINVAITCVSANLLPWPPCSQIVKMTDDILFRSCAAVLGNQTAVDALYDFGADLFIGDAITACSWTMSDILG